MSNIVVGSTWAAYDNSSDIVTVTAVHADHVNLNNNGSYAKRLFLELYQPVRLNLKETIMATKPEQIVLTRQELNCLHGLTYSAKNERLQYLMKKNWATTGDDEYLSLEKLEDKLKELRKAAQE